MKMPSAVEWFWGGVLVAIVYSAAMAVVALSAEARSRISIEPAYVGLYDLSEGERRDVTLIVKNNGLEPVALRVWGTCACTVPKLDHIELAPGESRPVPVTVDTLVAPGGNTAFVYIEDHNRVRLAQASVSFKSHKDYVVSPGIVSIVRGADVSDAVRLCSLGDGSEGKGGWRGCDVSASSPGISCVLVEDGGRCAMLRLKADPDCRVGVYSIQIMKGGVVKATLDVGVRPSESLVTCGVPRLLPSGGAEAWIEGRDGWEPTAIISPVECTWEPHVTERRLRLVLRDSKWNQLKVRIHKGREERLVSCDFGGKW